LDLGKVKRNSREELVKPLRRLRNISHLKRGHTGPGIFDTGPLGGSYFGNTVALVVGFVKTRVLTFLFLYLHFPGVLTPREVKESPPNIRIYTTRSCITQFSKHAAEIYYGSPHYPTVRVSRDT